MRPKLLTLLLLSLVRTSAIDKDHQRCLNYYNPNSFLTFSFVNQSLTYAVGKDSDIIKYFLNFNLFKYLSKNIVNIIPWVFLLVITFIGWLCCSSYFLAMLCKKKQPILTPKDKRELKKQESRQQDAEDGKKKADGEDSDVSGGSDPDEEEEDLENEEFVTRPENNYEFKQREYRILFIIKVVLVCSFVGLCVFTHISFNKFNDDYLKVFCRFTEMNKMLVSGSQSYHTSKFVGLAHLKGNATALLAAYESVSLDAANVASFSTAYSAFTGLSGGLWYSLDTVSNRYRNLKVASPSVPSTTVAATYLQQWASLSTDVLDSGDWSQTIKMFQESYLLFDEAVRRLYRSGDPVIQTSIKGVTKEQAKMSGPYKSLATYIEELSSGTAQIESVYTDISDSLATGLMVFHKSNPYVILGVLYGCIVLFIGSALLFELLFYKNRSRVCWKRLMNGIWCFCAPLTVAVSIFLNVLVPVIGGMSEINIIAQPVLFNRTFYAKVEFPEDSYKSLVYSCIFGDGRLHGLPSGLNHHKKHFKEVNDSINSIANASTYDLAAVDTRVAATKTNLTNYLNLQANLYNPTAELEKPTNLLQIINALTNCNTPKTIGTTTFNQNTACSGCKIYDKWVVKQADCGATPVGAAGSAKTSEVCFCSLE